MPPAKKTVVAARPPADQRATTLEYLILLNSGLSNALDALEIARDSAASPADRQEAENSIPAVVQAKALLKSKTLAFIKKSAGSSIAPPNQATVEKTIQLAEALAKVDAQTTQLKQMLSMTTKIVEFVNAL